MAEAHHLKYHLQLKTKENVEGRDLGLQRGGRQFTWRWKSKCLVNKHMPCLAETMEHGEDFDQMGLVGSSLSTTPSLCYTISIYDDISFLEQFFYLIFV